MELLAPSGSFASFHAAVDAGCDAVYFGVEHLNMRSRSSINFTLQDMGSLSEMAKERQVKTYLTLNTLLYDHDMKMMKKILDCAKESGVDGTIVSDLSALTYAREIGMSVSCSTQLSISNMESVRFFSQFADVIVLARELDLKMIKKIVQDVESEDLRGPNGETLKIEIFGHGALCIAESGRCSISLFQRNASANRGVCLQPCRAKYKVINEETGEEMKIADGYVMSPKDLSTIGILPDIVDAGVSVLKIEGRGRDPLYVKKVIETYREAINLIEEGEFETYRERVASYQEKLGMVYNRGFSEGYYLGRDMLELSGLYGSASTQEKEYVGKVRHYYGKSQVAEVEVMSGAIKKNDAYAIIGETTGVVEGMVEEIRGDGVNAESVEKGRIATFKTRSVVRKNDRVFIMKPRVLNIDQN